MPFQSKSTPASRTALNLRIKPDDQALIDRAAKLAGKTRTDFVLEAAHKAAVETLTERTLFHADPAAFAKFAKALDTAPAPSAKLKRTMKATAPWGKD